MRDAGTPGAEPSTTVARRGRRKACWNTPSVRPNPLRRVEAGGVARRGRPKACRNTPSVRPNPPSTRRAIRHAGCEPRVGAETIHDGEHPTPRRPTLTPARRREKGPTPVGQGAVQMDDRRADPLVAAWQRWVRVGAASARGRAATRRVRAQEVGRAAGQQRHPDHVEGQRLRCRDRAEAVLPVDECRAPPPHLDRRSGDRAVVAPAGDSRQISVQLDLRHLGPDPHRTLTAPRPDQGWCLKAVAELAESETGFEVGPRWPVSNSP